MPNLKTNVSRRKFMQYGFAATGAFAAAMYVKPKLDSIGVPGAYASISPGPMPPPTNMKCLTCIDFELDDTDNPLNSGDVITDQWAWFGIHFSALQKGPLISISPQIPGPGDPFHNNPLMIFDSSNPTGGDYDLGTPNGMVKIGGVWVPGQVSGAPGRGAGAGAGSGNVFDRGNVLILNERGNPPADDNALGGVIAMQFDNPVIITSVGILDIDDGNGTGTRIRTFDSEAFGTGTMTYDLVVPDLGDNSYQVIDSSDLDGSNNSIDGSATNRLEVHFKSSGALTEICFLGLDGEPLCVDLP